MPCLHTHPRTVLFPILFILSYWVSLQLCKENRSTLQLPGYCHVHSSPSFSCLFLRKTFLIICWFTKIHRLHVVQLINDRVRHGEGKIGYLCSGVNFIYLKVHIKQTVKTKKVKIQKRMRSHKRPELIGSKCKW